MQKSRRIRPFELAAFLAVMALSVPLVAGFFGGLHPALDSFSHFRLHLAALMVLLALPLLSGVFRREAVLAAVFGVAAILSVTGLAVLPGLAPVHAALQPKDDLAPVYRLMQFNLRFDNIEVGKVLSTIGRERPDIITLQEAEGPIRRQLAVLDATYPYKVICRHSDVVILSLRPFAESRGPGCLENSSFASASIDLGGRLVEVAAVHLHWPWPFGQSRDVERLRAPLAALGPDAIVAGDFNAVPWSATVRSIAGSAGMTNIGGLGATWIYRRLPDILRPLGLPIDHVLTRGAIVVHSSRTLEPAGSDHLPVLIEFSLKPLPDAPSDAGTTSAGVEPQPPIAG